MGRVTAHPEELAGAFVVAVGERQRTPFLVFYSDERDYELRLDLNTHWRVRFGDTEACAFRDSDHRWRMGLSGCGTRVSAHPLEVLSHLSGMTVQQARKDSDYALRVVFACSATERTHLTVSGERLPFAIDTPWRLHRCLDTPLEVSWRLCEINTAAQARHAVRRPVAARG